VCGIHDMDCDDDESDGQSGVRGCIILYRGGGAMYLHQCNSVCMYSGS
jgi:hypothetical protein